MKTRNSISLLILTSTFALSSYTLAETNLNKCQSVITVKNGSFSEKRDWNNDQAFLMTMQKKEILSQVQSFQSDQFQTEIHFTATARPNHKGEIPLVDKNAKAVFIFAHGSGTMKSGGRNFIGNMNTLANLGYSAISIDLPFHSKGPRTEDFKKIDHFMEWMRSIVLEVKKSGLPIVLSGHSFGPDVILEYVTRYPFDVQAVVALSPAGFTKELDWYQQNVTEKMNFGGEVPENIDGGLWAGAIGQQTLWNKQKLPDPTLVNPKLNVRILTGMREEYFPAPLDPITGLPAGDNTVDVSIPLQKMLNKAVITREPGIGHYLFDHIDKDGNHAVTRELLAATGESPSQIKAILHKVSADFELNTPTEKLAYKYTQDPIFKAWADGSYGVGKIPKIANQQNDGFAAKILEEFRFALKKREEEIFIKILNTKETHPEFYRKYQKTIDSLNPKKVDLVLYPQYLNEVLNKTE